MIGTRALLTAAVATAGLVPIVGAGGPSPEAAVGARRLVTERAASAHALLDALATALEPGVDRARVGTARIVEGSEPPGAALAEAATIISGLDGLAGAVRDALDAYAGARTAAGLVGVLDTAVDRGELTSIAAQLSASAAPADAFAEQRRRAERVTEALAEALDAFGDEDLEKGAARIAEARAAHEAIAAWEVDLVTLPVWLETTDAMIGAMETIERASRAGDPAAARAAADDFAALAAEAAPADRALRIAIGEGGSAITAAPMGRLAEVLRAIDAARATVAGSDR